jgi:hypothetical protein
MAISLPRFSGRAERRTATRKFQKRASAQIFSLRSRRARAARDVTGRILGNDDKSPMWTGRQKSLGRTGKAAHRVTTHGGRRKARRLPGGTYSNKLGSVYRPEALACEAGPQSSIGRKARVRAAIQSAGCKNALRGPFVVLKRASGWEPSFARRPWSPQSLFESWNGSTAC